VSKAKILIIEDDIDLRHGLTLRLKASGYDIVQATDGIAALSVAWQESPDAVLLDLGLPGGDGLTVLGRYANLPALCGIPVVVLTGRDPRTAEPATRKFNVAAFLQKPVDNQVLLGAIEHALGGEVADSDDEPSAAPTVWFI
jgi:DNA-binding response OmpR family regulator